VFRFVSVWVLFEGHRQGLEEEEDEGKRARIEKKEADSQHGGKRCRKITQQLD
jgi:hypothetical protein